MCPLWHGTFSKYVTLYVRTDVAFLLKVLDTSGIQIWKMWNPNQQFLLFVLTYLKWTCSTGIVWITYRMLYGHNFWRWHWNQHNHQHCLDTLSNISTWHALLLLWLNAFVCIWLCCIPCAHTCMCSARFDIEFVNK